MKVPEPDRHRSSGGCVMHPSTHSLSARLAERVCDHPSGAAPEKTSTIRLHVPTLSCCPKLMAETPWDNKQMMEALVVLGGSPHYQLQFAAIRDLWRVRESKQTFLSG